MPRGNPKEVRFRLPEMLGEKPERLFLEVCAGLDAGLMLFGGRRPDTVEFLDEKLLDDVRTVMVRRHLGQELV